MLLVETVERFTHFCRTGELHPTLPKKIALYQTLIRNKIDYVLRRTFPLTHHLLQGEQWDELTRTFIAKEDLPSPFFWKMAESFAQFVQKNHFAELFNFPYLNDLVHFEWIEIELYMMPDIPRENHSGLHLNPESHILTYSYPVFEKKKLPRPMIKGTYPLFAFRQPKTGDVHFIALSPFFQTVLELIEKQQSDVLITAAKKYHLDEKKVLLKGEKFLDDLLQQNALYRI